MKWHHKLLFVTFAVVVIGLVAGVWKEKVKTTANTPTLTTGTQLPVARTLPAFSLVDQNNQPFTQAQLKDHWSILFFGYTQCPELCPKTLAIMAEVKHRIGPNAPVQMILVSINPVQDSPEQMKSFLQAASFEKAELIGLTGKREAIQKLAQQIGLYVQEDIPEIGHIEHSGTLLVVNPHGQLHALITHPSDPQLIAHDLKNIVRAHRV